MCHQSPDRGLRLSNVLPVGDSAPPTLYLGISGVCHPSESQYRLMHGRSPWDDGHSRYESKGVLEAAIAPWPELELVLTSTQPWAHGLEHVLQQLGPLLAARVAGYTYEDLTKKVRRTASLRSGIGRERGISAEDYWRMSKSQIVAAHVLWHRPTRWAAVDDEDILWPQDVRNEKLVLTDGCLGLSDPSATNRLQTVLRMNFGG